MSELIDRIKKLQALADRAGTEAEAALAGEKVLELLAKYNLNMSDIVETREETVEAEAFIEKYNEAWRRTIICATADMYFCKGFFQSTMIPGTVSARPQSGVKYTFIGRKHNTAVAADMARYFVATINRLANEGAVRTGTRGSTERGRYVNSFRLACSLRLKQRIAEYVSLAKRGEAKGTDGRNLPALASLYDTERKLAERWLADMDIRLRASKSSAKFHDSRGVRDGGRAADSISLNTQIGAGNRSAMLPGRK